jgi:uncharacterized protein (TIGR00645 family)
MARQQAPNQTPGSPLRPLPSLIFASRWLQLPLYLGLIAAQLVYVWQFLKELWHLVEFALLGHGAPESMADFSMEATTMLLVLGLVDVVMISNLLIMVIIGGYETFVSRMRLNGHPDQPEWLSHVNASVLKVKLAMAIIGISSIHLLKTFIESSQIGAPLCTKALTEAGELCSKFTADGVMWQTIIHVTFLASALAIAYTDKLINSTSHHGSH